jgi:hypothetical protein
MRVASCFCLLTGADKKTALWKEKAQGHGSKEAHLHFIIGCSITSVARYSAAAYSATSESGREYKERVLDLQLPALYVRKKCDGGRKRRRIVYLIVFIRDSYFFPRCYEYKNAENTKAPTAGWRCAGKSRYESTLHGMEYILRELERNVIRHWTVLISTEH